MTAHWRPWRDGLDMFVTLSPTHEVQAVVVATIGAHTVARSTGGAAAAGTLASGPRDEVIAAVESWARGLWPGIVIEGCDGIGS
jgi:hypothetical protein